MTFDTLLDAQYLAELSDLLDKLFLQRLIIFKRVSTLSAFRTHHVKLLAELLVNRCKLIGKLALDVGTFTKGFLSTTSLVISAAVKPMVDL